LQPKALEHETSYIFQRKVTLPLNRKTIHWMKVTLPVSHKYVLYKYINNKQSFVQTCSLLGTKSFLAASHHVMVFFRGKGNNTTMAPIFGTWQ